MPHVESVNIRRIMGEATQVAPDEIGVHQAQRVENYDAVKIGNLSRRRGSANATLYDHAGDVMDVAWWGTEWGDVDVDLIVPVPATGTPQSPPYDPADDGPPGGGIVIGGGGGEIVVGGGDGGAAVEPPDRLLIGFDVQIPEALTNLKAFNVQVTAMKPNGVVDTTYTGAVTIKLRAVSSAIRGTTLTQNTAPAAVVWALGVALISVTINAPTRQLAALDGAEVSVKAISGADGRGQIEGISNEGFLTATGHLVVTLSASAVEVDETFTITVKYVNADGTTDATYAEDVTVVDGSGNVDLVDATGGAWAGFVAADFAAGSATETIKFSGAVTANEEVTITATEV